VGEPASPLSTKADWWANGFIAGYNSPDSQIERPLMINDEYAATFFEGVADGQQAARDRPAEIEAKLADQTGSSSLVSIGFHRHRALR
jgi:hypothetical protein